MNASSTNKVEKECFDIIVAMMSHTERSSIKGAHLLTEPFITQRTSGHFDAHTMSVGVTARTEMAHTNRDSVLSAQTAAESLIAIALHTTQLKIAMERMNAIAQFLKRQQQTNAVGSTTKRHKQERCSTINLVRGRRLFVDRRGWLFGGRGLLLDRRWFGLGMGLLAHGKAISGHRLLNLFYECHNRYFELPIYVNNDIFSKKLC